MTASPWIRCFALALAGVTHTHTARADEPIEFNRHVRPILADACFQCHGPDKAKRKADLRLDTEDGQNVLVPGKPAESELHRRITAEDANERMPPAKAQRQLKPHEIDLLRRWIEQGAKYQRHWALIPPTRPAVPELRDPRSAIRNPIDAFILARLQAAGLDPSPETAKATLIRRVTLDLTGLPPTPAEVEAWLSDESPDA